MGEKRVQVGDNYNGLVVERYLGYINKRHLWEVRCKCGKLKPPMREDNIRKSKGKCVCSKTKEGCLDLTGETFNKLTVLSLDRVEEKRSYWKVLCECGREYISRGDVLKNNKDGCGRHIRPHNINTDGIITVDVSTRSYVNIVTTVDYEDFHNYMKEGGWWAVKFKEEGDYYVQGFYKGKQCFLHQLISGSYFIEGSVTDHINGNTLDNRSCNLRITDIQGNSKNRKKPCNNTSGYQGISELSDGNYRAYVTVDGVQKGLGTYTDISEAIKARKEALRVYNFHENHDRFQNNH